MKKDEYFFEYPDFENIKQIVYDVVKKYPNNKAFIVKNKEISKAIAIIAILYSRK